MTDIVTDANGRVIARTVTISGTVIRQVRTEDGWWNIRIIGRAS